MFGLGMPELVIILVIALIIFGAGKLPQIGEGLGKAIHGFRRSVTDTEPTEDKPTKDESKDSQGQGKKP